MSAAETGQMPAVETRQMFSAETKQMSTGKAGRCPVSLFYTYVLSQQQTSVLSQQQTSLLLQEQTSVLSQHTILMSQKSQLWQCHNVQIADRRSGPKLAKMTRNGFRTVARPRESTQMNPTAISERLGPVPRPKTCQKRYETLDWPVPGRGP